MKISFDEEKRAVTLARRGLDFKDAKKVFLGDAFTVEDDRFEYPETRLQTYGLLDERLVMVVWTPRNGARHIISMRKCNDREKRKFEQRLGGS